MASWGEIETAEPDLAARAPSCFTATTNAVLGTVRADGSPRLSGIDPMWFDGDVILGSMPHARKGADLRRDPRLALHSIPWESRRSTEGAPPIDADAKLSGRAALLTDPAIIRGIGAQHQEATDHEPPPEADFFRVDVLELVVVSVQDDKLVIDRWTATDGRQVFRRD